ncbi:putative ABC transporter permease [Clostridium sp. MT-14]|uniref:putative ABC transporter permease n=1 Tax=Clostridium sp. MT-14 TaxID=3348360 RepID=UPI0035F23B22
MNDYGTLFLFFTFYSFLGWLIETTFASINRKSFVNRGFLNGPFCPIYGLGAVLVLQISSLIDTYSENYSIFVGILLSVIVVTLLEYATGFILEKLFNCKWWDYSDSYANIRGYICPQYSLLWGILAFLVVQIIQPLASSAFLYVPDKVKTYIVLFLMIYFMLDTVKSTIDALKLRHIIINHLNFPVGIYCNKIMKYERFLKACPRIMILILGMANQNIRGVVNDKIYKVKIAFKNIF